MTNIEKFLAFLKLAFCLNEKTKMTTESCRLLTKGPVGCGTRQHLNAKACVAQIKRGEWKPVYNSYSHEHLYATRDGLELWIGNGSFFCEINGGYFGVLWRHWVWWAAARKMTRNANRNMQQKNVLHLDA